LSKQETLLLGHKENVSSGSARKHPFLFSQKTMGLVEQQHLTSCSPRALLFLFDRTNLFNSTTMLLLNRETFPLVQQEDMASC
jgi:hypothetical protein